ncbi:MAG: galactose ABC transporter substrate-binding protein [Clostridia bacterium]
MKKKVMLVLCLLVCSLLVGVAVSCSKKPMIDDVSVFIYDYKDAYISSVRKEMEKTFSDKGMRATFYDGGNSAPTQKGQIESAIASGTKMIVVNIVDVSAGSQISKLAKDANIPVVFFNREITDADLRVYDKATFVGTSPQAGGQKLGEIVAKYLFPQGKENLDTIKKYDTNGDKILNYAMLRAEQGNPEADARTKEPIIYLEEYLQGTGYSLSRVGADLLANWDQAQAKNQMDSLLASNPLGNGGPEIILANNDMMALGAVQSLNDKGYNRGGDSKVVPVFGVDALDVAVKAIDEKKMAGTVKQDGVTMAKVIVGMCHNIVNMATYSPTEAIKGLTLGANDPVVFDTETLHKVRIPYQEYTGKSMQ